MERSMTASTNLLPARSARRPQGNVVAFSATSPRRFRREASTSDGPLGQILLFTGVRYERMSEESGHVPQRKHS